jgi:hypothetical protein
MGNRARLVGGFTKQWRPAIFACRRYTGRLFTGIVEPEELVHLSQCIGDHPIIFENMIEAKKTGGQTSLTNFPDLIALLRQASEVDGGKNPVAIGSNWIRLAQFSSQWHMDADCSLLKIKILAPNTPIDHVHATVWPFAVSNLDTARKIRAILK